MRKLRAIFIIVISLFVLYIPGCIFIERLRSMDNNLCYSAFNPNEWIEEGWEKAYWAIVDVAWKVVNQNGLKVAKYPKYQHVDTRILSLSEGDFIAKDHGEWGGGLYYYPKFWPCGKQEVIKSNINNVLKLDNDIYALGGLAHLSISEGAFYRVDKNYGRWVPRQIANLEDAPYAYTISEGNIYIVTHKKLIVIENKKDMKILIGNAFWEGLYPNSIAYDERYFYIGMRAGIAKVDKQTLSVKWLTKKER